MINILNLKSYISKKSLLFTTLDILRLKKPDDYENIYSLNPLCLMIGEVEGFIEEKNGSKYLVFELGDENKEILKKLEKFKNFGMSVKKN